MTEHQTGRNIEGRPDCPQHTSHALAYAMDSKAVSSCMFLQWRPSVDACAHVSSNLKVTVHRSCLTLEQEGSIDDRHTVTFCSNIRRTSYGSGNCSHTPVTSNIDMSMLEKQCPCHHHCHEACTRVCATHHHRPVYACLELIANRSHAVHNKLGCN